MNGLLYIDKPKGWTSFDVVAYVRNIVRRVVADIHTTRGFCYENEKPQSSYKCRCKPKVGHTGTLDPAATGLLIVCIGSYTKKVATLIKQDKTYDTTIKLGATSTTGDSEGTITAKSDQKPTFTEVKEAFSAHTGTIMQVPPVYSAIKINGERAYARARAGKKVTMQPRQATVYSIVLSDYRYPEIQCRVHVASGVYIRSLAEDIGSYLKVGAYMSQLRRIKIGDSNVADAVEPQTLTEANLKKHLKYIDD